ncbi:hypothetical protein KA089_00680 [Candidatus Woesebacteria bacterium]|nr:hypothetical protein [Candidatus Woesebacteria bacterium]
MNELEPHVEIPQTPEIAIDRILGNFAEVHLKPLANSAYTTELTPRMVGPVIEINNLSSDFMKANDYHRKLSTFFSDLPNLDISVFTQKGGRWEDQNEPNLSESPYKQLILIPVESLSSNDVADASAEETSASIDVNEPVATDVSADEPAASVQETDTEAEEPKLSRFETACKAYQLLKEQVDIAYLLKKASTQEAGREDQLKEVEKRIDALKLLTAKVKENEEKLNERNPASTESSVSIESSVIQSIYVLAGCDLKLERIPDSSITEKNANGTSFSIKELAKLYNELLKLNPADYFKESPKPEVKQDLMDTLRKKLEESW